MVSANRKVAIIIPCRNEEKSIATCLDSLLTNGYEHDAMEIVVIDGMSDDTTRAIVRQYQERHVFIRLIDNHRRITPVAINLGIAATTADYVFLVGAHTHYPHGYIRHHDADLLGPILEAEAVPGLVPRAIAIAYSHRFANGNATHRVPNGGTGVNRVQTVAYGCYRRRVFDSFGTFNEYLVRGQDREFNLRISRGGGRVMIDRSLCCTYRPRTTLSEYASWMFRGAFWLFYAQRFTNTMMWSHRNFIPLLFMSYLVFLLISVSFLPGAALTVALVPLATYAGLVIACSLDAAVRGGSPALFLVLLMLFPLTHICYGAGGWAGRVAAWGFGRPRVTGLAEVDHR